MDRRLFIQTGALLGIASPAATGQALAASLSATPGEAEGPFYPVIAQKDKDFDLTRVDGQTGIAKGTHIIISGEVVDIHGSPIEDATVDIWQANAFGRYRHPHDRNQAPLDENFQGWAIVQSGSNGTFRFRTVLPGAYPATRNWVRPPHIHYKISKKGYPELVTQMYFPDMKLNESDRLLRAKTPVERELMIASKLDHMVDDLDVYFYRVVLAQA
jgi:protocatechuate 3,4-dioxygenase beta subunit